MREIGENRAGRVPKVPEVTLGFGGQCNVHFACTCIAKCLRQLLRGRSGGIRVRAFDFGQQDGRRTFKELTQFVVGVLTRCGIRQKGLVEHLARAGASFESLRRGGGGCLERWKRAEDAACCRRHRCQGQLDADEDRQRSFTSNQQIDEIRLGGVIVDSVTRRILAHADVGDWPAFVGGDDVTVNVSHEARDRSDTLGWRLAAGDNGTISVAEHAIERVDPCACRTVAKAVSAGGVG